MIKPLEIKTLTVFNLLFANNTILLCFFFFSLIIELYFLIPAFDAQIFNPSAELAIPTETPTNERDAETETQPLTVETKTRKYSRKLKSLTTFVMLFAHQIIMFYFL